MNSLMQDLEFRGILKQLTDPELGAALTKQPLTLYCGFDPTSDSLHVGNLLPLLILKRFQMAGHKPIAVIGGATGMIGDPSGKSAERSLLGPEQLAHNLAGIKKTISKFLDFSGPNAATVVDNASWFKGISFIDFLRDIGKHFTINHMMAKESVRSRLEDREHGISYTEFSYMLLQAFDFLILNEKNDCALQIGGSDQWGNITAGIDLIRKVRSAHPERYQSTQDVFGLTHPLVAKADGTKFGKSESGALWLDAHRTSPYQFYQFFIQTSDADVMNFVKFFTLLSHEEINALEISLKSEPEKRLAQTTLAREVTKLVHGEEALHLAEAASTALFGTSIKDLDESTLLDVLGGAPSTKKDKLALQAGVPLLDLLVETSMCQSKGAARKDMTAGGIYLNNERITEPSLVIQASHLIAGAHLVLRKGKKTYHLVSFS